MLKEKRNIDRVINEDDNFLLLNKMKIQEELKDVIIEKFSKKIENFHKIQNFSENVSICLLILE